jgi:hypothetical protein
MSNPKSVVVNKLGRCSYCGLPFVAGDWISVIEEGARHHGKVADCIKGLAEEIRILDGRVEEIWDNS